MREWLLAEETLAIELGDYIGQWVAVGDHHVVAHAETLRELLDQIEREEINMDGLDRGIFQVIEGPCFFAALESIHKTLDGLEKVGAREIPHLYQSGCPDEIDGFEKRDPDCPACHVLDSA
jgi:hypothetical protein